MSNINRIFLKAIGCFLSVFLVATEVSLFVDPSNFYYNIIYKYYDDYNEFLNVLQLFVFLIIIYLYILRFLSAASNKAFINFAVSTLISIIVTLIFNKYIYQNTDYTISLYCWSFCAIILIGGYLFDRFLYKDNSFFDEIMEDLFNLSVFLFFATLIFSRVYWCFMYFDDYKDNLLMIFNIFEMFNETYLEYFMQVFILIYAALCAVTFLLFVIANLSTVVTYADMFIGSDFSEYDEDYDEEVEESLEDSVEESDEEVKKIEKKEEKD